LLWNKGIIQLASATLSLLLMIIGYILAGAEGPFSWQEEHLLKEGVVDALFENP